MAVFSVSTWRPLPGRAADMLGSMARAKPIFETNGGLVSLWQPVSGGQAGTIDFVVAYDSPRSYGRTMDAIRASTDWQEFWTEIMADPSATNVENYTMQDLNVNEPLPDVLSTVVLGVSFRTRPGRLGDHLTAQATAQGHLQRLGARPRALQVIGRNAGEILTLCGFEDFAHYGEFGEKFAVDEQWAGFWAEVAKDPPAEETESVLTSLLPGI